MEQSELIREHNETIRMIAEDGVPALQKLIGLIEGIWQEHNMGPKH